MSRQIIFSNYDDVGNPYYGGGGAHAIHQVASRLAPRHSITVVTGRYPRASLGPRDGVSYDRLGPAWAGPRLGQLFFQFLLPWEVRRRTFDLWVESLTPPFSTACLQWFTPRPVILLTQVLAGRGMARKYHLPFHVVERLGLRTYRYGIVLSRHLEAEVRRANPALRTVVIPNGVSRDQIDPSGAGQAEHALFLGRLDIEQKGLDLLLEALARLGPGEAPPVVIAGGGPVPAERELAGRIEARGLGQTVRCVGRVTGAAKLDLLRRAFCLLLPSRFEASPLVVAEAFAAGVPVLHFAIPELSDLPERCCLAVPPFDTAAFGNALVRLVRDAEHRASMGQAAREEARRYDWDVISRRYEDFFESVLEAR